MNKLSPSLEPGSQNQPKATGDSSAGSMGPLSPAVGSSSPRAKGSRVTVKSDAYDPRLVKQGFWHRRSLAEFLELASAQGATRVRLDSRLFLDVSELEETPSYPKVDLIKLDGQALGSNACPINDDDQLVHFLKKLKTLFPNAQIFHDGRVWSKRYEDNNALTVLTGIKFTENDECFNPDSRADPSNDECMFLME